MFNNNGHNQHPREYNKVRGKFEDLVEDKRNLEKDLTNKKKIHSAIKQKLDKIDQYKEGTVSYLNMQEQERKLAMELDSLKQRLDNINRKIDDYKQEKNTQHITNLNDVLVGMFSELKAEIPTYVGKNTIYLKVLIAIMGINSLLLLAILILISRH
ncbi:MAG: hypothetical protein HQK50_00120 [Oligoflexia bacterium]|nr:hypothetical protein [Oligoflexia bacterium]MBF0363939.1 hypothetical protein [Oligoflexia bacterium]